MKEANRDVLDRGSLADLLVQRARNATDVRLVVDASVGLLAAALVAVLRPPLWLPLSALAFSLGAFGIWGILDREANDPERSARHAATLAIVRAAVAVAGVSAAVLSGVILFFSLLGTWIS